MPRSSNCVRQSARADARVPEQHALGAQQPAHAQVELELLAQPLALRGELIEQHAAHGARPDHPDRERVRRQVEPGVHRAQRAGGVAPLDHGGDVALGGALGDRAHVDAGGAERSEHLGRDARGAGHAIAHHREDRQVRVDVDALDLAVLELALEGAHARMAAARSACSCGIAQQIECSELPCEIRMTEMPSSRSAPNRRCAVPGTPIMPVPSRLTSATRSMLVMPFTGSSESGCAQMSVPTLCGAKVLRIQIGMLSLTAGAMVFGWITLAPK